MSGATLDDDAVFARVRGILAELLMLAESEIRPDTLLVQDLGLDSLGFVELEFSLEEQFGIKFPDVKMSPELFAQSLPESVSTIEAMPGGTTLFEFMKTEVVRGLRTHGAEAGADRDATPEALFRVATVADLARAVGGPVPSGLEGAAPLETLHIAHLFRFVTAEVMARYVRYLVAAGT